MKYTAAVIIVLSMLSGLAGCSSAEDVNMAEMTQAASYDSEYGYSGINDVNVALNSPGSNYEYETTAEPEKASEPASDNSETEYESKIIRNANIGITATDVRAAYKKYLEFIRQNGGYEFNVDIRANDLYTSISATIKIKPENLNKALEFAGECGNITYSSASSSDITAEYYDSQIRLDNKRKNLEKYYEYLGNAYTMDEIIQIQNQIDIITSDIESFEGQLRLWDSLTSESTITLEISQEDDPDAIQEEFDWNTMTAEKMGRYISNGFKKTLNTLISLFQWLIIIIVTLLPLFIIAAVIIFITILVYRKKKKKRVLSQETDSKKETYNNGYNLPEIKNIQKDGQNDNSEEKDK